MTIEMQAEMATCLWFSIGILKCCFSPCPASLCTTQSLLYHTAGLRGRICMYLCIVFPVIITYLQKWTAVKEEGKSMRHPHLSQLWWKCLYFASRRNLGIHLFMLQLPWLELADDHRYHSTKFSWSNLRRNFGDWKYPLILPFKEPRKGIWCNLLPLKTNAVARDGFEWKSQQQYFSPVVQNCWDKNLTNFPVLLCSSKTVKRCKTWK